jgi:hypothetical protein
MGKRLPDPKWPRLTTKAGATPPYLLLAQESMDEEIGYIFIRVHGCLIYLTPWAHFLIIMQILKP